MWGRRKKQGARKRRDSGRTCPFCESENEADATTCHQCYYELDVKAMHQSTSEAEVEKDTLWGELLQEVDPNQEDDYSISVITMDEMTVEIDQYETVGDDDVIIMSEGGPTFAEIMNSEVAENKAAEKEEEALVAAPTPSLPKIEAVVETPSGPEPEVVEDEPESVKEPEVSPVPPEIPATPEAFEAPATSLTPPPVPSISGFDSSEEELDDDLDDIIAAARNAEVNGATAAPPSLPTVEEVTPVEPAQSPPPIVAPQAAPIPPPLPAVVADVPTPETPVVESMPPAAPATPPSEQVNAPPAPPAAPAIPNGRESIWPWPQSEPWDSRELRREIIDAMAAAQRGDRTAAAEALDRFGPHLGDRFEAMHHVGALLHSIGRQEEMKQMVLAAKEQHPDDPNVSTAAAALMQS